MNSYTLSVNINASWVISNSKNGTSNAIDEIKKAICVSEKYTAVFLNKNFISAKFLIFSDAELNCREFEEICLHAMPGLTEDQINVSITQVEEKEVENLVKDIREELNEDVKNILKNNYGIELKNADNENSTREEENYMEKLIGFEPLKQWVNEVSKISEKFGNFINETGIFRKTSYLISVNVGNGRTTILQMMRQIYKKYRLINFDKDLSIREKKLIYTVPDARNMLESASLSAIIEDISNGFNGIMAVDISEWMDHLDDRRIDILLDVACKVSNEITFVFFVPYVEQSVLERVRLRIDDMIVAKTMRFVPPSDEQYFLFFKNIFEKAGIYVDDSVYPAFVQKITEERNDGRFYSFNTVMKMANELLYSIIADAAQNDTKIPESISNKDVEKLYKLCQHDEISGLESLNGMVALEEVKNKVKEILATLKMQKQLQKEGKAQFKPCYHMMFTGNPGTGKTVVARIIGRIFKEEGLLSVGNFYEVSRKDFVGQYVGHTAPKTMELCRNAYGSVLFIDEAYMLADKNDSYSKEAIGTLIAEMENNRDKMVVIFAGYEKELLELFELNPGLRDRVPHIIKFPNYTRDELKQIFYMQMNCKMNYDSSFMAAVDTYFREMPDEQLNNKEFSNGRFIRNLVERIISKSALRFDMNSERSREFVLSENDFKLAVETGDVKALFEKEKNVRRIGF